MLLLDAAQTSLDCFKLGHFDSHLNDLLNEFLFGFLDVKQVPFPLLSHTVGDPAVLLLQSITCLTGDSRLLLLPFELKVELFEVLRNLVDLLVVLNDVCVDVRLCFLNPYLQGVYPLQFFLDHFDLFFHLFGLPIDLILTTFDGPQ